MTQGLMQAKKEPAVGVCYCVHTFLTDIQQKRGCAVPLSLSCLPAMFEASLPPDLVFTYPVGGFLGTIMLELGVQLTGGGKAEIDREQEILVGVADVAFVSVLKVMDLFLLELLKILEGNYGQHL